MDKRKSAQRGMNVGLLTIVVLFTVLCLTIFAVLCLSTALSEEKLAAAYARSVENYYAADLQAQEIAQQFVGLEAEEAQTLAEALELESARLEAGLEICYSVPVDEVQELYVALLLTDSGLQRSCWQLVESAEWEPDYGQNIWDGSELP